MYNTISSAYLLKYAEHQDMQNKDAATWINPNPVLHVNAWLPKPSTAGTVALTIYTMSCVTRNIRWKLSPWSWWPSLITSNLIRINVYAWHHIRWHATIFFPLRRMVQQMSRVWPITWTAVCRAILVGNLKLWGQCELKLTARSIACTAPRAK